MKQFYNNVRRYKSVKNTPKDDVLSFYAVQIVGRCERFGETVSIFRAEVTMPINQRWHLPMDLTQNIITAVKTSDLTNQILQITLP
jgi:hypothetical protein